MKFNDTASKVDDIGKNTKVSLENESSLVVITDIKEQKQQEETVANDCNGGKDLTVGKTVDVLEQTPLATSTPCVSMENGENNEEKVKVCCNYSIFYRGLDNNFL